jgi:hypothetical protein
VRKFYSPIAKVILILSILSLIACGGGSSGGAASDDATLASLTLTGVDLDQIFQSAQSDYSASAGFLVASVHLDTPASDSNTTVRINGVLMGAGGVDLVLAEGANVFNIEVTAEDGMTTRAYTLEVTRNAANTFAQRAYAKASNTDAGDSFGHSVALDGDTLAVGAWSEDSNGTGVNGGGQANNSALAAGAVYVFTRSGGVWSQQAYVKASNTDASDQFGFSVALDGDTLAVGANRESSNGTGVNGIGEADDSASQAGAVYVFTRSGGVWSQQAYVKASNTDASDHFGQSVALDGNTLVVGALDESSNGTGVNGGAESDDSVTSAGAVYVFTRSGGVWSQQAYVKASNNPDINDLFGHSVTLDGDTLAVGSWYEDSNGTGVNGGGQADNSSENAGAVYVFTRSGGVWSQQAYVKASNTNAFDQFGFSVALDGDTLAVGANGEDSNGTGVNGGGQANNSAGSAGAVYVFTRSGGVWSQQAYVKASNPDVGDLFGENVALDGDTMAIGAYHEDSNGTGVNGGGEANNSASRAGAVYVFTRSDGMWSQQAYVKASNTGTDDYFSRSLSLDGDTLAVGARYEGSNGTGVNGGGEANNSAFAAGAVYVLH